MIVKFGENISARRWRRALALAGVAVATAGCAAQRQASVTPADPSAGTVIALSAPIDVPAGARWARFAPAEAAGPVSLGSLLGLGGGRDATVCGLALSRRAGAGERIAAGPLQVLAVERHSDPYGIDPARVSAHSGYDTDVTLSYRIHVRAEQAPQLAYLFCRQRHAQLARGTAFPDSAQLRAQAGDRLAWPSPP